MNNKKVSGFDKINDAHVNRMLISTVVSFALLLILLFVHQSQMRGLYLETRTATFVMSIIFLCIGAVLLCVAFFAKKGFIYEYAVVALVMAFCFYGIHGVRFLNAQKMKYATSILVGVYFAGSFIYHTYAPKYIRKKK